jgi:hypothetical protein
VSRILLGALVLVLLAGCGSSGRRSVTVPAYGEHPAQTIAAAPADPRACRADAGSFAAQSRAFLAHSGPQAAYPADLWYVILREALADFRARSCDPAILGRALDRQLTPKEEAALVDGLPASMAGFVRAAVS